MASSGLPSLKKRKKNHCPTWFQWLIQSHVWQWSTHKILSLLSMPSEIHTLHLYNYMTLLKHIPDEVLQLIHSVNLHCPQKSLNLLMWPTEPCLPLQSHLSLPSLGFHAPAILKNLQYSPHRKDSMVLPETFSFHPPLPEKVHEIFYSHCRSPTLLSLKSTLGSLIFHWT